jgi:hypothetical protein
MLKPLRFTSIGESSTSSQKQSGSNGSNGSNVSGFFIDGSGIFPPFQKLFQKLQKVDSETSTSTNVGSTLPSIVAPVQKFGRSRGNIDRNGGVTLVPLNSVQTD